VKARYLAGAAAGGALALRVIPAWRAVFTPAGINFQENDAWFHVRTVHNLLAHFPLRSGFDPYMRFPGGGEIPTGPAWDYAIAIPAWILGFGSPSPTLVDTVAAWLPAILGALMAPLVFVLARRLFGRTAGLFAALWIAVIPGVFLWVTHLGLSDHHAAESFLALLVLLCLCEAIESGNRRYAIGAGLALGAYLATRPNGVFVPGILACGVLLAPMAAPVLLRSLAVAAVLVFAGAGPPAWLSLAVAAAACFAALLPWKQRTLVVAAAMAGAFAFRPHWLVFLLWQVRRYLFHLDSTASVQELAPLLRSHGAAWHSVFYQVGFAWIPALAVLPWVIVLAVKNRRPALTLFVVWSIAMAAGGLAQVRMVVYLAVVAAILAGAGCALLTRERRAIGAGLAALVIAANLPASLDQLRMDAGPSDDWRQALSWLRTNSPEPLGDAAAWYRRYPAGAPFVYPPSAFGVAVNWEYGYWVESLARRMPSANPTGAGAPDMASFFTSADPAAALDSLRQLGARYFVLDPRGPVFGAVERSIFSALLTETERDPHDFFRLLIQESAFERRPLPVYLPRYYRSMAVRLYLTDGEAVTGRDAWVFETQEKSGLETIVWSQRFALGREAAAFLDAHPERRLLLACIDPGRSCVDLEAADGLRRVFSSDPLPVSPERPLRAVKVFEVAGK
jgi:asparagine N-glycosylation enzyme membrane subunit Stt3